MSKLGAVGPALRLIRHGLDRTVLRCGAATVVLVALSGAMAAGSPLALKYLVDAIAGMPDHHMPGGHPLLLHGAIYLLLLAAGRLATDIRPLLTSRIEQRVLTTVRQRFFAHVLRLPMGYLVRRRHGELMHSIDLAAAGAQAVISHVTNSIAPVLIELALMTLILAKLQQPELVVLFVATSLLYLAVYAMGVLRQRPAVKAVSTASLDVHSQLSEGISHVEILRCFGAAAQAERSLLSASANMAVQWLRFNRLTMQSGLAITLIFALTQATCLAIAANAVAEGRMTVGGFVLTSVYTLQMVRPLEMLGAAARDLARAVGFMQPLLDILAQPPGDEPKPSPPSPAAPTSPANTPSIRLEGLRFGYDPQHPVLRGLDLEIAAGRMTALVGRSGSGKSSLIRLLLRLYEPQAGRILIGGRPLATLPNAELRALIGLVPQDAGLLPATVSGNISLGLPGAMQQDIELAARHAQIHEVICCLSNGYDTLVGDRGQTLSGGERQRLAIARALLRQPRIYLLDEPTSMLDSRTEGDILQALRDVTAGCTTLVIAHRLSTIMDADDIVVLERGQVHERGRHAELIAKGGLYALLWRQQTVGAA